MKNSRFTENVLLGIFGLATIIGTSILAIDLSKKQKPDENYLVYPNAVPFEDVQVIAETLPTGERSVCITEANLRMKDYTSDKHYPFISAKDYHAQDRFDEIRLFEVPKGSHLERFANLQKLEEAYSAYTNARAQK
jgi:hypothetical protein